MSSNSNNNNKTKNIQFPLATNVSKPENKGTGRTKITDYLITTSFQKGESLVRRTYDDFDWLQEQLVLERMGIIVPVLPIKRPLNAKQIFSEEFIQERQEGLDRFLRRVIHHRELIDAPCLLPFLTANPNDWESTKQTATQNRVEARNGSDSNIDGEEPNNNTIEIDVQAALDSSTQPKRRGKLGQWFAQKRDQWALQKKNLQLEETPAETKKFTDLATYADHLEICTRILCEDYKEIMSSSQNVADKYQSMGAAFTQLWGEHELSNTSSSTLYQTLGQTWANVSKRIINHIQVGKRHFHNPIDDLTMDVMALKAALIKRKEAVYNYTKKTQEARTLNEQMEKIRASADFTGQQDKYYKLEKDIRQCDATIEEMQKQCEIISTRLLRDVERFRVEWHERMRQVLEVYHKEQIEYLQKQAMDFSTALPALSTLETQRSELPKGPTKIEQATGINMTYNTEGAKVSIGSIPIDQEESYPEATTTTAAAAVAPPPVAAPPPPPVGSPINDNPEIPEQSSPERKKSFESVGLDATDDTEDDMTAMGGEIKTNDGPIITSI